MIPRAQLAFKDSMVHGILQFTPRIAFRYVLHRCKSRDIRCRESSRFSFFGLNRGRSTLRLVICLSNLIFLGGIPRRFPMPRPFSAVKTQKAEAGWAEKNVAFLRSSFALRVHGSCFVKATTMILPQVHLRKPCYDFSFL